MNHRGRQEEGLDDMRGLIVTIFIVGVVVIVSVTVYQTVSEIRSQRQRNERVAQFVAEDLKHLEQEKITLQRQEIALKTAKLRDKQEHLWLSDVRSLPRLTEFPRPLPRSFVRL